MLQIDPLCYAINDNAAAHLAQQELDDSLCSLLLVLPITPQSVSS
jgi:hypothetical protein